MSRFAHLSSEEFRELRRTTEKIISSGASYRLALVLVDKRLPKKLPSFPFHRLPAEIGPLATCRTVLPLPAGW